VRRYVGALFAASVVCAAADAAVFGWRSLGSYAALVGITVLLAASERLMLRFHYRKDVMTLNLFEAILAPLLFAFSGPVAMLAVAVAQIGVGVVGRNKPLKAAFNVAQWTLAAGVGSLTYHALHSGTTLSARNLGALVVAMIGVAVVNQLAFAAVIRFAQGKPFTQVLSSLAPSIFLSWTVNTAFGIVFVTAYAWSAWLIGIFAVPLLVLHWAYRGHASAAADRARLTGLHRATAALAVPVDPRDAIPDFLVAVRDCFQARTADLVILNEGGRSVHRVGEGPAGYTTYRESPSAHTLAMLLLERGKTSRVSLATSDAGTSMMLELEDCLEVLAAPLVDGDQTIGVLCVYDPGGHEGFAEGEIAVLDALATEVSHAMLKAALLDTVLEERQKLADIVGRTSDGILTIAPSGTIRTWNAALERITGHRAENMIGSRLFGTLSPRDADGVAVWLERWADDDATLPADVEIATRTGESRWLSCSYTRVSDAEGKPSMLIVVARDATEAHELERLKDDFVATVSHELRTPLTPIKGWAVTLLQLGDHLSADQRDEGMQAILRHSERLERLITNILEVSKVERGISDRRETIVDVLAVAQKTVVDFRNENGNREIVLEAAGDRHLTRGDEVWIEQILSNLLSNAIKYSPANLPIEVTVHGSGETIELSVTDRGPGIPEHEVERIFERFKRLGDHMTRSQGGTGLGLYIARQLARAIGGELSVRSAAGQGATFTLRLTATTEVIPVAS
jgi:PAS domain S-box-containing protein